MQETPHETMASIQKTLSTRLRLWAVEDVDLLTAEDEMDFDNLDLFGGENLFIEEDGFRIYPFDGLIKNLSETGVAFFANRELIVGDLVQFEIEAATGPIVCRAEVVRIEEERTTKYHKMFGCRFVQSGKELPKYLFELQREKLRKSRTVG